MTAKIAVLVMALVLPGMATASGDAVALSKPLAQALANVKAEQDARMQRELKTSWRAMRRDLDAAQVAQRKPASIEREVVRAAP